MGYSLSDLKKDLKKIDDDLNLSETGKDILSGTSLLLTAGAVDVTGERPGYVDKLFVKPKMPAIPELPSMPTYDAARAALEAQDRNRQRRGRAASILSERPNDPLGYTGGARLSVSQLLGG